MLDLLKYLGVFNIFFFGVSVLFLYKKIKLKPKKYTVSWIGSDKKYSKLFSMLLASFAVNQVIFSLFATWQLFGDFNSLPTILFIFGGVLLLISSVFKVNKWKSVHNMSSLLSATLVWLAVLRVSIELYPVDNKISFILVIGNVLVLISFMVRNKLSGIYWEIILFLGISIWNISLSSILIGL